MDRSPAGKSAEAIRGWATWYLKCRKLEKLSVDQLFQEALREQGTHAGVTKTKIRSAVSRLIASGRTS